MKKPEGLDLHFRADLRIFPGYLSMQSNRRFFVAATTDKSEASRIKKEAWHRCWVWNGLKMGKTHGHKK